MELPLSTADAPRASQKAVRIGGNCIKTASRAGALQVHKRWRDTSTRARSSILCSGVVSGSGSSPLGLLTGLSSTFRRLFEWPQRSSEWPQRGSEWPRRSSEWPPPRFRVAPARFRVVPARFRVAPARFRVAPARFRVVQARFRVVQARFRGGSGAVPGCPGRFPGAFTKRVSAVSSNPMVRVTVLLQSRRAGGNTRTAHFVTAT